MIEKIEKIIQKKGTDMKTKHKSLFYHSLNKLTENRKIKITRMNRLMFFDILLVFIAAITLTTCKDDKKSSDCNALVRGHPGYEVWAGDSALYKLPDSYKYFYAIDKYGYKLIGSSTTTQTFNTGNYKYYVIVAKYFTCIDAIRFNDSSYYDYTAGTLITGLSDYQDMIGPPDGVYGRLGWKELCVEGSYTFDGFITDPKTILSRGGGLTVIIGNYDCQNGSGTPGQ
jgi:hypothetical protein